MIVHYEYSIRGKSHIENNVVCQDANKVIKLENGWIIAAVADGVGSAKNADIGSRIAVEAVVSFCEQYMPRVFETDILCSSLMTAYFHALKLIESEANKSQEKIESYDTTLDVVIYDGFRIVYGHSGDGGIIGLTEFGEYVPITSPQKGEDLRSVIPLRFGKRFWKFGAYEENLCSVFLVTDGLWEILKPNLLNFDGSREILCNDGLRGIFITLAMYFCDPCGFNLESQEANEEIFSEIKDFVISSKEYDFDRFYNRLKQLLLYRVQNKETVQNIIDCILKYHVAAKAMISVTDDKTIVVLISSELPCDSQLQNYYYDPDWIALSERYNTLLYSEKQDQITSPETESNHNENEHPSSYSEEKTSVSPAHQPENNDDPQSTASQGTMPSKNDVSVNNPYNQVNQRPNPPLNTAFDSNPGTQTSPDTQVEALKHPTPRRKGLKGFFNF